MTNAEIVTAILSGERANRLRVHRDFYTPAWKDAKETLRRAKIGYMAARRARDLEHRQEIEDEIYQAHNHLVDSSLKMVQANIALGPVNARLFQMRRAKVVRGIALNMYRSRPRNTFKFGSAGDDIGRRANGTLEGDRWVIHLKGTDPRIENRLAANLIGAIRNHEHNQPLGNHLIALSDTQDLAEQIALDWICEGQLPEN